MSKTVHIGSARQFSSLLQSSKLVVADFYADWCGPCKTIAPMYEQLSAQLSRPNKITFVKVDVDVQKEVAAKYQVTAMPTFMIFKNKEVVESIRGADPRKLSEAVKKLVAEADSDGASGGFGSSGSGSGGTWNAFTAPKGYGDVTTDVDVRGLDLLNSNSEFGTARVLFNSDIPTALNKKGKHSQKKEAEEGKDWVESDTDEQLMLYVPFMSTMKVHSLYITSVPPNAGEEGEEDEIPMKPKTIKLYLNRPNVLGFDETEDVPATQSITLNPSDWDEKTGTAKIELRFVKFQNVKSLVIFVVDGDGDGEKTRIDRLRFVGESGEKRNQGKLEKVGHED